MGSTRPFVPPDCCWAGFPVLMRNHSHTQRRLQGTLLDSLTAHSLAVLLYFLSYLHRVKRDIWVSQQGTWRVASSCVSLMVPKRETERAQLSPPPPPFFSLDAQQVLRWLLACKDKWVAMTCTWDFLFLLVLDLLFVGLERIMPPNV